MKQATRQHRSVYETQQELQSPPPPQTTPSSAQEEATCSCASSLEMSSECDCEMQGSCLCDATCSCGRKRVPRAYGLDAISFLKFTLGLVRLSRSADVGCQNSCQSGVVMSGNSPVAIYGVHVDCYKDSHIDCSSLLLPFALKGV